MMEPIETANSNFVFSGNGEDIIDLPCEVDIPAYARGAVTVYSVWKPSREQREAIAAGANIKLGLLTETSIPPITLDVTDEEEVE
jgi:hypothetical protein